MLTTLVQWQFKVSPKANANPSHVQAGHRFSNIQQIEGINQVNYSQAAMIKCNYITSILDLLSELTVLGKTIYLVIG